MDPGEEQANELEALEAIFDSDYRVTEPASKTSGARFEIELSDFSPDVKLRLVCTHPLEYPDVPLQLVVYALSGISISRRQELQTFLGGIAEKNIGLPSAYTVCQAAQDWVEENVTGVAEEEDADEGNKFETLDATQQDKVEVISSKAVGTPVTVESFSEWREKFMEEMGGLEDPEKKENDANLKMSGREFFESKTVVVSAESESFWEQEASQIAAEDL